MRLSLRFLARLASLYSKFSERSPYSRARFTSSISCGRSSMRRWSSSSCIFSISLAVSSSCIKNISVLEFDKIYYTAAAAKFPYIIVNSCELGLFGERSSEKNGRQAFLTPAAMDNGYRVICFRINQRRAAARNRAAPV